MSRRGNKPDAPAPAQGPAPAAPKPAEEPMCFNCRFWSNRSGAGVCRRYPKTVQLPYANLSVFPPHNANDWCGEHQRKDLP